MPIFKFLVQFCYLGGFFATYSKIISTTLIKFGVLFLLNRNNWIRFKDFSWRHIESLFTSLFLSRKLHLKSKEIRASSSIITKIRSIALIFLLSINACLNRLLYRSTTFDVLSTNISLSRRTSSQQRKFLCFVNRSLTR